MKRSLAATILLATLALPTLAADHRDGPLATSDPSADLNDVYLFVNPNDSTELVIILTFHPDAPRNARFSDAVEYITYIDNGSGTAQQIACTFPDNGTRVSCSGLAGALAVDGPIETINSDGDLRVFAGLRDDPFFFDSAAFNRTRADVAPRFTNPGVNGFADFNTLVLALGVKHARLTGNGANPVLKVHSASNRVGDFGVSPGHSGMWFDAANPGHGLLFQALGAGVSAPSAPREMVVYWTVFDNSGNQLNVYGVGAIDGDRVTAPVVSHTGGMFPPAFASSQLTEVPFGTLQIDFSDCNNALLNVQPTRAGFAPTSLAISRLTPIEDLACTFHREGQIDRNGRPAINTALINVLGPANGLKDTYNRAVDPAGWAAAFQAEMTSNLAALDTLDGVTGNAVLPAATLASVLVDDRLVIDTRIASCGAYLAVELGVAGQCGGRTITRDVIDDSFGAIIGPGVSDNVAFDSDVLADFPFVAPPQ